MNVWIIEDNPATRMLMHTLVNSGVTEKHVVTQCASVEEAFQKLETLPMPDVFVVDVNLPGASGLEFCAEIRKRTAGQSEYLPYLIVVTANEGAEILAEVLDSGANDYLSKPVHVKVLQTRLRIAEGLIDQANFQAGTDYIKALSAFCLNHASAPAAIVEVQGPSGALAISFANASLLNLLNSSADVVVGSSLVKLQEWNDDMVSALQHSLARGEAFHSRLLSHSAHFASLDMRVSAYPVSNEGSTSHYLVIEDKMLSV